MPIETTPGGTIFTGKAINWFALVHLKGAIQLFQKGIRVTRGINTRMLVANATGFTGTEYPASKKGLERALEDVQALLATRRPDDISRVGGAE
jgi:hypothetical protein